MFSKRSVETPRLIMITTYTNMTYHEYPGIDIALFLEKLSKVALSETVHSRVI